MSRKYHSNIPADDTHTRWEREQSTDSELEAIRPRPGRIETMVERLSGLLGRRSASPEEAQLVMPGQDLRGRDFSRRNLQQADFSEADLRQAVFTEADLSEAHLPGADLQRANLANACLVGADLRGARLCGANLIGADFAGADLSGADLGDSYIWGADFNGCDVGDANFTGAYAGGALFSHARNLTLAQFRSTIHDETGAYRLSMFPDALTKKGR